MTEQQVFVKRRKIANWALAISLICYIFSLYLTWVFRGSVVVSIFKAVAEAALVGGVADWFAITALFRKPLGFPYHTALIPRNRERLARAMAAMVQNELLSPDRVGSKLRQIHFVKLFIFFMEKRRGKVLLRQWVQQKIALLLQNISGEKLERQLKLWLDKHLADWNGLEFLCRSSASFLESGREQAFILFFLQQLQKEIALPQTRQKMADFLSSYGDKASRPQANDAFGWLKSLLYEGAKAFDMINFKDAATALQEELLVMLQAMESENHPVRLWLKREVYEVLQTLSSQEEKQAGFLVWQRQLVAEINFEKLADSLLASLIDDLSAQDKPENFVKAELLSRPASAWILLELERFWSRFLQDSSRQLQAEALIQDFLQKLVSSHHQWIGDLVYEVLTHLPQERLNQLIEEKAGADLQWVRINGALVGGFVGLILSLFLHYLYS